MNAHTRRAVAYIAGGLANKANASSVYDYDTGRHFPFSGTVGVSTGVYDHTQRCHVGGSPPSLHHYGNGRHITLTMHGAAFSGYDYDSGRHFSGRVSVRSVSLYDYDGGGYHNYSL
jgi:hypothetical protein